MKGQQAFTLFELIVTMAVIAILSVIAIPTFIDSSSRQNFNLSVAELRSTLETAQSNAAIHGQVTTVIIGPTTVANTAIISNWVPTGTSVLLQNNSYVYFSPDGYAQNSLTNSSFDGIKIFTVCDNTAIYARYSRTIRINRLGVILDEGTKEGCSV